VVGSVLKDSSAAEAGLKTGDIIVSVWGKMLKYMQPEDIYATFLGSSVSELKIVIERAVSVETNKRGLFGGAERLLDGKLMMEFQGLTVAAVKEPGALARAGVLSGDMITGINEVPTRYMSLDAAYRLIERSHDSRVTLEVQRECIVWKKG